MPARVVESPEELEAPPEVFDDDAEDDDLLSEDEPFGDLMDEEEVLADNAPGFPTTAGDAPSLVSQLTPSRSIGAAREVREKAVQEVIETDAEFQAFLGSVDSFSKGHVLFLHRRKPEKYKGELIEGYCTEYTTPPSMQEIKDEWGGGHFEAQIHGPIEPGTSKRGIKHKALVKIAGRPKVSPDPEGGAGEASAMMRDLLAKTMEQNDKDKAALRQQLQEMKEISMQQAAKSEDRLTQFLMTQSTAGKPSKEEMQLQLEREKSEREERAEQRRLDEERRKEERKEREEADRRHEERMQQFQLQMMQMQQETKAESLKMMEIMMKGNNNDKTLAFMQQVSEQRATAAMESNKFMMQQQQLSAKNTLDQVMALQGAKDKFFESALKVNKSSNNQLGDLIALGSQVKELGSLFGGGEEDKGWAAQLVEGVKDILPAAGVAAQAFRGPAQSGAPPQQTALPPGTVAEVDLPPEPGPPSTVTQLSSEQRAEARRQRREARAKREALYGLGEEPPAPTPQQEPQPPSAPEPEVLSPEEEQAPPAARELTEEELLADYMLPPEDKPVELGEEFQYLVRNVEVALRKDDDDVEEFAQQYAKLSENALVMLKEFSSQQMLEVVKAQAPPGWRVHTLPGSAFLRELHQLLVA